MRRHSPTLLVLKIDVGEPASSTCQDSGKREYKFQVIRLRSSGQYLGTVRAPDAKAAKEEFLLRESDPADDAERLKPRAFGQAAGAWARSTALT
jgi:hypothetical protein